MPSLAQTCKPFRLCEHNHIERLLIDQLAGRGWEVVDLTSMTLTPVDRHRESFTEVMMTLVPHGRLRVISWLEDNQIDVGVNQFAGE